jgi:hypothetical protein
MWCSTPLVWPTFPFLLFDLLFHSFCSTCYFTPFVWPITPRSTWCFTPLVQLVAPLFLFDLLFCSSYLTYYYAPLAQLATPHSTWCSAPFIWLVVSFFLLDLLLCSSCSTYCSTPLAWLLIQVPLFYVYDFLVPFVQHCYSCSSCFKLVFPPLYFFTSVKCGGVVQIWILQARLGRWNFLFSIFVCWWILFFLIYFGNGGW